MLIYLFIKWTTIVYNKILATHPKAERTTVKYEIKLYRMKRHSEL